MASKNTMLVSSMFLMIFFLGFATEVSSAQNSINIGAIIDLNTRVGKEQRTAMIVAADYFNSLSTNTNLVIHFPEKSSSSSDPIEAVFAAVELIRERQVEVIVGLKTWEQATLVADVGRRAHVPVLSLTSMGVPSDEVSHLRWPFLVPIIPSNDNDMEQIDCISAIVQFYAWRKVIVIYEENFYSNEDSGMLAMLSSSLQNVGVEIESYFGLSPPSSLIDLETVVSKEIPKLLRKQSRVFIVLQESLPLASNLFKEAKRLGLMGRDSAWIISDGISDQLDSIFDKSFFNSAEGALGIKRYYSKNNTGPYQDFSSNFKNVFRYEYPDEPNYLEPGIHALQAYDAITAIYKAVENSDRGEINNHHVGNLLHKILESNFTGFTGSIRLNRTGSSSSASSSSETSIFRVINVIGNNYKELGFWSSGFGFSVNLELAKNGSGGDQNTRKLKAAVNWPGELINRIPKGWAMPTDAKPMRIAVPYKAPFEEFVQVVWADKQEDIKYGGFCIELFKQILEILQEQYPLPYEFHPLNGSYEDLINRVITKEYDAVIGDITISANRSGYVEFTQPFAESGLSMVVPVKSRFSVQKLWLFTKPFKPNLWITAVGILLFTLIVICIIESFYGNEEFGNSIIDQLRTSLSYAFGRKEGAKSNYSKVVLVMWACLLHLFISGYQASLTSMLSLPRLDPQIKDLESIRSQNLAVGCNRISFAKTYLTNVLKLRNIKEFDDEDDYQREFKSGNIAAAFLEVPHVKVFLEENCNKYTVAGETYNFGGLGFVFQKGSPIARDFSKAILTLSENKELERLQSFWFKSKKCAGSDSEADEEVEAKRLRIDSFWVFMVISASISFVCFLIILIRCYRKKTESSNNGRTTTSTKAQPSELALQSP